jgi:hypothetical protein
VDPEDRISANLGRGASDDKRQEIKDVITSGPLQAVIRTYNVELTNLSDDTSIEIGRCNSEEFWKVLERLSKGENLRNALRNEYADGKQNSGETAGARLEELTENDWLPEEIRPHAENIYFEFAEREIVDPDRIGIGTLVEREEDYHLFSASEDDYSQEMEIWKDLILIEQSGEELDEAQLEKPKVRYVIEGLQERDLVDQENNLTDKSNALEEAFDWLYNERKKKRNITDFDEVNKSDLKGEKFEIQEDLYENLLWDEIVTDLHSISSNNGGPSRLKIFKAKSENPYLDPEELSEYMKKRYLEGANPKFIEEEFNYWRENDMLTEKGNPTKKFRDLNEFDEIYTELLEEIEQ